MKTKPLRNVLVLLLSLVLSFTVLSPMNVQAQTDPNNIGKNDLQIYEVYGGGGNSGSIYRHDVIVLKNTSKESIDLSDYSIYYAASSGAFNFKAKLEGTLEANQYYVLQGSTGTGGSLDYPRVNQVATKLTMAKGSFKVLLTKGSESLVTSSGESLETLITNNPTLEIIDLIGVGDASIYLGDKTEGLGNNTSFRRIATEGNNSTDYTKITHDANSFDYLKETEDDPSEPTVDKSALNSLITSASNYPEESYEAESFAAFTAALEAARAIANNETATQEDVNAQVTALNNAIANLVKIEVPAVSVTEAREIAIGNPVTVKGIVTYINGTQNYIIQDENSGINIYDRNNALSGKVKIGDELTVSGMMGEFRGLLQVTNPTLESVTSSTSSIPVVETSLDQVNEALESRIVTFKNVTLTTVGTDRYIEADGKQLLIYRAPNGLPQDGTLVNVTGLLTQYNDYQLLVKSASDVVEVPKEGFKTIAEARKEAKGTQLNVSGIIQALSGKYVWIADNTDAMLIYGTNSGLNVGDKVDISGIRDEFNGVQQLTNPEFTVISSGNSVNAPLNITIGEYKDGIADLEGHKITFKNLTVTSLNPSGTSTFSDSEGNTIDVYRIPSTDPALEVGQTVNLTGMGDNHKGSAQIKLLSAEGIEVVELEIDPISNEEIGDAHTVLSVVDPAHQNQPVTVVGAVAYINGTQGVYLQDTINNEIYGIYVYDFSHIDSYKIGDVVRVSGTYNLRFNVPQIQTITSIEVIKSATAYKPQEVTIADIKANHASLLNEYVVIKDVTLGTYYKDGSTYVKDSSGEIAIYKGANYPAMVNEGDVVELYGAVSAYNTTPQLHVGNTTDYKVLNDTKAPVITDITLLPGKVNQEYPISGLDVQDNVGIESVTLTLNDSEPLPFVYNSETQKYDVVIPAHLMTSGTLNFVITATDVNGLVTTLEKSIEVTDKPEIESVKPAPNTATKENKQPTIEVAFTNAGENPKVELVLNDQAPVPMDVNEELATFTLTSAFEDGVVEATVIITRQDGEVTHYSWKFTIGEPLYNFYFGQIHAHTAEYSDGQGTLAQALNYARNEAYNLDFVSITDHSNYFDTPEVYSEFDKPEVGVASPTQPGKTKWEVYRDQINNYNEDGEFVTFAGFEMSWAGGPGHMNTFNTDGFVSRNHPELNSKSNSHDDVLKRYYNLLKEQPGSFSMFNHPGTTFGTFNDFAHWDPAADARINLLEVGNGEGQVGSSGYWPSYNYYTQALDKGWKVAPTNGQDNHKGRWGDANTTRTVAIANELTREAIFDAINDMMVYATEDDNFEIYYTANDLPMGSTFAQEPETLRFIVSLNDPDFNDVITKLDVITNGGVVAYTQNVGTNSKELEFTIPNTGSYYYLRVTQADGQLIVTAPVWTGSVSMVGVNKTEKDTAMEVINKPINVSTELYNYEDQDLVINKVTYSVNERVLKEVTTDLPTLSNSDVLSVTHEIIPDRVGEQYLMVDIEGTLGDRPVKFSSSIKINVYDERQILSIAIDAGHTNFYVSGDYAESDANFIQVAAQLGGTVDRLTQELTYETLKDYQILVLTVPYISFEKGGKTYTDAELEAIAQYAQNGGNIILTSKSDRGDVVGETSIEGPIASDISNGILEAIGAKARIGKGIVVDLDHYSNQTFRFELNSEENFNEVNELSEGLFSDTTGLFSLYNSAPVIANGATPIVKGYASTWAASFTEDFGGVTNYVPDYENDKVVVPKGEVNIITTETLPGGGFLVTSGVTFFSTFEVKTEMLQDRDQRTANYRLVQNIVNMASPKVEPTPIAEVHEAEEGQFFAIEGILTSNASGYDRETAFFDSAYVQDETGGINIFPIAGNYQAGQRVYITGTTSSYNGERQININTIEVVDETINPITPEKVTIAQAIEKTGSLVEVSGEIMDVTMKDGVIESIIVKDETGTMTIFIDGYIMPTFLMVNIEIGNQITAVGLSSISIDDNGNPINRIRVRNRSEVTATVADDPVDSIVIPDTLVDTATGIIASNLVDAFNEKVTLVVKPQPFNLEGYIGYTYDIYFVNAAGKEVQPKTSVVITLPLKDLNADTLEVLHHTNNGLESLKYTVENNGIKFLAESFSLYSTVNPTGVRPTVDKSELEDLYLQASKLDLSKYTDTSRAALAPAMREALAVLEDDSATQEQVNKAIETLIKALAGLKLENPETDKEDDVVIKAKEKLADTGFTSTTGYTLTAATLMLFGLYLVLKKREQKH